MYDGVTTTVRSAAGLTKKFKVDVGLHQGSAHSAFLFCHHHRQDDGGHQEDSPWDMLFADDIVLSR